MICNQCDKEIPDGSEFCPFCGCSISKLQPSSLEKPSAGKKNKIVLILLIILILVLSVIIGGGVYYYINVKKGLETQIDSLQKCYNSTKEELRSLKIDYNELQKIVDDYNKQADDNEKNDDIITQRTMDYLLEAKTTNGIISVDSKLYYVKRGESKIVKVNWPSYETTMYMGTYNTNVATASWTDDNNIRITGDALDTGVTKLYFGSNSLCTTDYFSVVIIVY